MANQKRIPFIPQQTPDFKPMRYYYCETDVSAKSVTRSVFLRLLEQQSCPMAQVNIDLDGGYANANLHLSDYIKKSANLQKRASSSDGNRVRG